jgi:hypothetical protein
MSVKYSPATARKRVRYRTACSVGSSPGSFAGGLGPRVDRPASTTLVSGVDWARATRWFTRAGLRLSAEAGRAPSQAFSQVVITERAY